MSTIRYKSRFNLPREESDFVCALAQLLKDGDPDQVLAVIVRQWARGEGAILRSDVWARARADGRGGWRRVRPAPADPRPPPGRSLGLGASSRAPGPRAPRGGLYRVRTILTVWG